MSSTLFWRPTNPRENTLPDELKRVIARNPQRPPVFWSSAEDMAYIQGLIDAKVEGAKKLMVLVKEHGSITLWEDS